MTRYARRTRLTFTRERVSGTARSIMAPSESSKDGTAEPPQRLLGRELLGQEGNGERPPRELGVGEQPAEGVAHEREPRGVVAERRQAAAELGAPRARVEVGRERLAPAGVERQLAARVAAGRVDEERAADRRRQLVVVDRDGLPGDVDEYGQQLLVGRSRRLELLEPVPQGSAVDVLVRDRQRLV